MEVNGERTCRAWLALAGAVALAVIFCAPSSAIEFRAGKDVTIGADEVIEDDLYVTGETVTVDGTVHGDLVASGREVRVAGEVTGDLMAAGQAVIVAGRVGDDVRIAGMALRLEPGARVEDDVVAAGFSLESAPGSLARGTLLFAGFQALLAGDVGEGLRGSMAALEIRGGVGGDSEIVVDGDPDAPSFAPYLPSPIPLPAVPGGLTLAEGARIGGRLVYTSSREARGGGAAASALSRREPAAQASGAGEAVREPIWPRRLLRWAGLLVLGLLLVWWTPEWLEQRSAGIESRPMAVAVIGLVGLAALPVALLVALGSVVVVAILLGLLKLGTLAAPALLTGLYALGLVALLFWLTASYLAPIVVGLCTGRFMLRRVGRGGGPVLALVAGLALLALLQWVPWLGGLVALVVVILGWGAVLYGSWRWLRPAASA